MIVEIDAGNTRIKWRAVDTAGQTLRPTQSAEDEKALLSALVKLQQGCASAAANESTVTIERLRIASVRDSQRTEQLKQRLKQLFAVQPEQAKTSHQTGFLRNSYADPERMGVDRWSAMVAASQHMVQRESKLPESGRSEAVGKGRLPSAFCVISAGTAVTVDFVGRDGLHGGGYILPGFRLQVQAVLGHTDRVMIDKPVDEVYQARGGDGKSPGAGLNPLAPANNTSEAVHSGVLMSQVSLINNAVTDFAASQAIEVYLSGGDAALLAPHINHSLQLRPELVLDGLKFLLP